MKKYKLGYYYCPIHKALIERPYYEVHKGFVFPELSVNLLDVGSNSGWELTKSDIVYKSVEDFLLNNKGLEVYRVLNFYEVSQYLFNVVFDQVLEEELE